MTRAERNIAWCEKYLFIPEGKFAGKPLRLAPFMREDFRLIFDNPAGTRRAIISRGRKNAKTVESACITLLFLVGPEARVNGQLYSAARSRDQAAVLFKLAAKMVRMNKRLGAHVRIRDSNKELYCWKLGTLYKALSKESSTAFGLSPVLVVHDELGQVKGPTDRLYEALETATAAQEEPLTVIISTQAPTDGDLLSVLIDDAAISGDPKTVLRVDSAPDDLDPFSEEAIRAANPAYDFFMNQAEVRDMAEQARRMPSRQAEFENLVLNRRVDASSPFVSRRVWASCGSPVIVSLAGLPCFGGLDLSEVNDLTALVLLTPVKRIWHCTPTFWLPGVPDLKERARTDRVPYDVWNKKGFINTTPGKTVDYEFVARHMFALSNRVDLRLVHFDRWNYRHLKPWLKEAGFTESQLEGDDAIFKEFGQGYQSMSPALRDLEGTLLNEELAHGMHPVMNMCAENAMVESDGTNRKLTKKKSHGRIDGMVALTMARAAAALWELSDKGNLDDFLNDPVVLSRAV